MNTKEFGARRNNRGKEERRPRRGLIQGMENYLKKIKKEIWKVFVQQRDT